MLEKHQNSDLYLEKQKNINLQLAASLISKVSPLKPDELQNTLKNLPPEYIEMFAHMAQHGLPNDPEALKNTLDEKLEKTDQSSNTEDE